MLSVLSPEKIGIYSRLGTGELKNEIVHPSIDRKFHIDEENIQKAKIGPQRLKMEINIDEENIYF
jgi:mRNA-degrading endonuclease RelE of RelBE toxin-antitoxin system